MNTKKRGFENPIKKREYLNSIRSRFEDLKNNSNEELAVILNHYSNSNVDYLNLNQNLLTKEIDPVASKYGLPTEMPNGDPIPNWYTRKLMSWEEFIWLFQMRDGKWKDITIEEMMKHDPIA